MSDDLLERATRALRETSAEPQPRSGLTRARILASAQKRYSPRGIVTRWLIGIGAVLAASTALARVAEHWPEIKQRFMPDAAELAKSPSRRSQPTAAKAPRPVSPGVQSVAVQPSRPAPADAAAAQGAALAPGSGLQASGSEIGIDERADANARPEQAPRRRRDRAAQPGAEADAAGLRTKSAPSTTPPVTVTPLATAEPGSPPESAELALFRRAERLHLAHDPGAVAAWDAYLRVASQGVLVPEARYNRALALVRQGRIAEARHALGMFARGEQGGYRRVEAQRLLEALAQQPDRR